MAVYDKALHDRAGCEKVVCNKAQETRKKIFFMAGLLAVCAMALPYLVLHTDAVVTYHDQLDGELIAYILQARHLFEGNVLPEFMGGAAKTALTPPAPMCVLLFLGGNYFAAYVVMQIAGSLVGYVGMYLLAAKVTQKSWTGVIVGVLFAYLPFLPVYGLSQYGIPLLLWFFLQMRENRCLKSGIAYAVLYALNSSLVLVGFAVLGLLAVDILWRAARKKKAGLGYMGAAWLSMFVVYIAENAGLIVQVMGQGAGEVSHKAEYALAAKGFWESLKTGFLMGGQHSEDGHLYILIAAAAVPALFWLPGVVWERGLGRSVRAKSLPGGKEDALLRRLMKTIQILLSWNVLFAVAAALWNGTPGIMVRSHLHALGAFQLDRVLWIAPSFWYLILACVLAAAARYLSASGLRPRTVLFALVTAGVVGITGINVLKGSNLKPNVQKMLNHDYSAITYGEYYALGVMDQVKDYIRSSTGQEADEYRVASLGMDPAASLYAGFYTLDGYSNNYSLDYKHSFREIIAPELAKSDYLREYFDDWGNRCYLLTSESPAYYTIEKGGFFFGSLNLNMDKFREMGGKYVFSAAYIQNAQELGLELLREEPFETPDSYYRIFLYGVGSE